MSAVLIALVAMGVLYFLGYRVWSRYVAEHLFQLRADEVTPANQPALQDGIDYVPTPKAILWGHHYTSVAGAAPIIGPAVAVFWGWLPTLLWIVFGSIFIGAVHDFGTLVVSARHQGRTMADIAATLINGRVRLLFQIIIYFLIWIVLAVFGIAIGVLFEHYPSTVIPVNFQILVALVIGFWFRRNGQASIFWPSIVALILLYAMIPVGLAYPIVLPATTWAIILLVYAAVASVMPVWMLLQPRDYINSHQLIVGLVCIVLGLFVLNPEMAAPAINWVAFEDGVAPPLLPVLFVTIACGAISGFHGLVSSGTTSKQINAMPDARAIGYGAMLGEAVLAVIATIAVAAGLENWGVHYHNWNESGLHAIAKFTEGAGHFVSALGLPVEAAQTLVAILAISFAATSMDTAARIQRFIVTEWGETLQLEWLKNRYVATGVAVLPAAPLVIAGASAYGPLWLLFGTTNQLIGGVSLLILLVYLMQSEQTAQRPRWAIVLPMVFVVTITTGSMCLNLWDWTRSLGMAGAQANAMTLGVGWAILVLSIWMLVEAGVILKKQIRH